MTPLSAQLNSAADLAQRGHDLLRADAPASSASRWMKRRRSSSWDCSPGTTYQVEIDDEEIFEADTDPGGILELDMPRGKPVGVRIRDVPASQP